jgi:hypothetical protein
VEGWTDRYFYDEVCETAVTDASVAREIRTGEELPEQTGGKEALLSFFCYLRTRRLLVHEFKRKRLAVLFYVDKDIDDYLKIRKRSPNLVYTEHYAVENYLIRHSDLAEIAAAAARLDLSCVRTVIADQQTWTNRAAMEWKEWTKLCVLSRKLKLNAAVNYGRPSQINNGAYGGLDPVRFAQMTSTLRHAAGLTPQDFQRKAGQVGRFVDKIFADGRHDVLFKGSWYVYFLAEDVHRAAAGRSYNQNGFQNTVLGLAASKLDFSRPWAAHLTGSLNAVLVKLSL